MAIGSLLAVYFVVWWISLFVILPIGSRSQADANEVHPGSDPGAPALMRFWPKLLANTVFAALVTAVLFWGLNNPLLKEYWR